MTKIIAISNQKGGVGKTTSATSLSAELALAGKKTLLVDFDPQGNATSGLGVEFREEGSDLYDMFFDRIPLSDIIRKSAIEGLDVAPASKDLVGIEIELGKTPGRELILKSEIELLDGAYEIVLIDCPPSSGLLTLNALGAASDVIVPLQAEYYALEGISGLISTIEFVRQTFNPRLNLLGVFLTMFDARTNLAQQVASEARNYFGDVMFRSVIPRNIRLSESPSHGLPISQYAPDSAGAIAYKNLAEELLSRMVEAEEVLVGNL